MCPDVMPGCVLQTWQEDGCTPLASPRADGHAALACGKVPTRKPI